MIDNILGAYPNEYLLAIAATSVIGGYIEIINPSTSKRILEVRNIILTSNATNILTGELRTASSGGTSSALTVNPLNTLMPAARFTAVVYSVIPTPGTLLATVLKIGTSITGSQVLSQWDIYDPDISPIIINPGEVLLISASAATSTNGQIVIREVAL